MSVRAQPSRESRQAAYADDEPSVAAELHQQREWFRVTLASIADAVITTDVHGRVAFMNPAAEALTKWTSRDAIGQDLPTIFNIINGQTRKPPPNPVVRVLTDQIPVALTKDTILIDREGGEIVIEDSASPMKDAASRITGVIIVFRDVTERRKIEQGLERSEQLLADFFENAAVGLHWVGPDGTILRANRTELEMLGYSREEYVGHNIAEFHVDGPVIEDILRKLTCGDCLQNYEARLRCKNGSIKHVLISSNAFFEGGRFVHTRCFTRDITEQKEAREIRDRLAAVVDSSDDAIISKTLDGIITTWNKGAEEIFGYRAEEVIGKPVTILIPADRINEEPQILKRLRQGEKVDHYETIRRRKDGTLLNISLTVSPICDANGRIVGASKIARDITQRVRAESALREAQEKLSRHAEELEQQVNDRTVALQRTIAELESFSYSISHDLRAPLRAMQSFALILAEECASEVGDTGKEYIRRITTAAERMDRLIRDVLTYSRVARDDIHIAPVNVQALLRDILESYPNLHEKGAYVELKGAFPIVLANEAVLTQCMSNLLGNAIKFVARGTTPQVEVWSEIADDGRRARLFFKDNGIGIDATLHEKIFGIFERASTQYEGTGIGLAIVKKGMERIGGQVGLESKPGQGSTFWMELPLARRDV
jgi:PAS domain S-box-containing protein